MKSIACWISKGGSGKTSTTGNLVFELRRKGRVLAVDADPQGNLSSWLHPAAYESELADVLSGDARLEDAIRPLRENLDILPTFPLGGSLKEWAEAKLSTKHTVFTRLIRDAEALGYDFVVFDMGPGASILEKFIVASVDEALPVLRPETFSVDGYQIFEDLIKQIREDMGGRVQVPRIVVNGINQSIAVHRAYLEALKGIGRDYFVIPTSARIPTAQHKRQFLQEYAPGDDPIAVYGSLAEALA